MPRLPKSALQRLETALGPESDDPLEPSQGSASREGIDSEPVDSGEVDSALSEPACPPIVTVDLGTSVDWLAHFPAESSPPHQVSSHQPVPDSELLSRTWKGPAPTLKEGLRRGGRGPWNQRPSREISTPVLSATAHKINGDVSKAGTLERRAGRMRGGMKAAVIAAGLALVAGLLLDRVESLRLGGRARSAATTESAGTSESAAEAAAPTMRSQPTPSPTPGDTAAPVASAPLYGSALPTAPGSPSSSAPRATSARVDSASRPPAAASPLDSAPRRAGESPQRPGPSDATAALTAPTESTVNPAFRPVQERAADVLHAVASEAAEHTVGRPVPTTATGPVGSPVPMSADVPAASNLASLLPGTDSPGPPALTSRTRLPPAPVVRARPAPVETIEPRRGPSESEAIYSVIGRYRSAFNELNASVAKSIWPSVDQKALGRAFGELQEQELVFDGCQIQVTDPRATASCRGRARYVPKVGSKNGRQEPRRWTFNLLNTPNGWIIDSVQSR